MIMLRVIDFNFGKPDERVELSELTDTGLQQIKFECQQMIEEIEEIEHQIQDEDDDEENDNENS